MSVAAKCWHTAKMAEGVGNAPTSGLSRSCFRDRQAEFWRLCRTGWCATYWKKALLPGIAPGGWPCASTSVAGRHSALKSQPRKLKGPGVFMLPARAISTKNKHLLAIYSIPARGFTAAVSVFRGTPPPKPFNCKIWSKRPGACFGDQWAHPIG